MKTILISAGIIIIIVLLLIIAVQQQQQVIVTTPAPEPIDTVPEPQPTTPRAADITLPPPSARAPETQPLPPGVPAEQVYPTEVHFWVNEIRVPPTTAYEEGLNFIPIKEDRLKTFAGSFGPYFENPIQNIHVILCAEFYKVTAAPACEIVPIIYRDRYVSFAQGYQFDEYIGGLAAKDYIAYYTVYSGDAVVAESNRAVIRTVRD